MAATEPMTRGLIERVLRDGNWKFSIDEDGDVRVQMSFDDTIECELTHYFKVLGDTSPMFRGFTFSDRRIMKRDWERAMTLCNSWNRDRLFPKVFLAIRDPEADSFGRITCELNVPTDGEATEAQVSGWCDWQMISSHEMWKWLKEEGL